MLPDAIPGEEGHIAEYCALLPPEFYPPPAGIEPTDGSGPTRAGPGWAPLRPDGTREAYNGTGEAQVSPAPAGAAPRARLWTQLSPLRPLRMRALPAHLPLEPIPSAAQRWPDFYKDDFSAVEDASAARRAARVRRERTRQQPPAEKAEEDKVAAARPPPPTGPAARAPPVRDGVVDRS